MPTHPSTDQCGVVRLWRAVCLRLCPRVAWSLAAWVIAMVVIASLATACGALSRRLTDRAHGGTVPTSPNGGQVERSTCDAAPSRFDRPSRVCYTPPRSTISPATADLNNRCVSPRQKACQAANEVPGLFVHHTPAPSQLNRDDRVSPGFRSPGTVKPYNEEFDPGSGRTLAACLMHASRTECFGTQWRTAE